MLVLNNIEVTYSEVILVLKGVSLTVPKGGIVAIMGANGAGKTTTLKAISGLLYVEQGKITHGNIEFDGMRIDKMNPQDLTKFGIVQILEGRQVFENLTAEENLKVAGYNSDSHNVKRNLEMVYHYFPRLREIRHNISGYLSGGEQQMCVIGRALMTSPKLMLLDEPSLGLSPLLTKEIFEILGKYNHEQHTSILLVEQNALLALKLAEYGYVMENGRTVMDGPSSKLSDNPDVREFYLGLADIGERKSFRDVKHYKRRKRWQ
jgi:branched-chain amino acid transport system ATP-binding protein